MEDTGSLSVFDTRDVSVGGDTYRLTASSQHGVVYLRRYEWGRPGPLSGYVSGLGGNDPHIALFEGYGIPAVQLEQLRRHIEAFHDHLQRARRELSHA